MGDTPWKYSKPQQFLDNAEMLFARLGWPIDTKCPALDRLRIIGDQPMDAAMAEFFKFWSPGLIAFTIYHRSGDILQDGLTHDQWFEHLWPLMHFDDPLDMRQSSQMLMVKIGAELSPAHYQMLVDQIMLHHPNPKAWMMHPDVIANMPSGAEIDISHMAAPDFPELASVAARVSRGGVQTMNA